MSRAVPDRTHELAGMSVICWGVSFNPKGEPAWILGVDEAHNMPYCISKELGARHGIWCSRDEFKITDDRFTKRELGKSIKRLEKQLEEHKTLLSKYDDLENE